MTDIPIITSPLIPLGTVIIGALGHGTLLWEDEPLRIRESPWLPNPAILPDYERDRARALEHLAALVDAAWESMGEDPDQKWRAARLWGRDRAQFRAEARIGLMINRPSSVLISGIL